MTKKCSYKVFFSKTLALITTMFSNEDFSVALSHSSFQISHWWDNATPQSQSFKPSHWKRKFRMRQQSSMRFPKKSTWLLSHENLEKTLRANFFLPLMINFERRSKPHCSWIWVDNKGFLSLASTTQRRNWPFVPADVSKQSLVLVSSKAQNTFVTKEQRLRRKSVWKRCLPFGS